jgi:hypothetical protein
MDSSSSRESLNSRVGMDSSTRKSVDIVIVGKVWIGRKSMVSDGISGFDGIKWKIKELNSCVELYRN